MPLPQRTPVPCRGGTRPAGIGGRFPGSRRRGGMRPVARGECRARPIPCLQDSSVDRALGPAPAGWGERMKTPELDLVAVDGTAGIGRTVAVLLPRAVPGPFDYTVPPGISLSQGDYVWVPLQGGSAPGIVWGPACGDLDAGRMKPVGERLPLPPMPLETRQFLERAARYTITPLGMMLSLALRPSWVRAPAALAKRAVRRSASAPPAPDRRSLGSTLRF